jgi:hypothetical protein
MATFTHDEVRWAAQTAAQLRLLQADCSDADAGEREQYLHDEISRALKDVVRERHPQHLEALAAQFPTGEGAGVEHPTAAAGSTASVELTPEELLAQMVKIAPLLPRRKLQDFGLQLQQAGYLELQTTALADAPPEELLKRFPIDPLARVDLQRLYRLTAALADFFLSLDQLGWNLWKAMSPRTQIRRDATFNGDLRQAGARYLAGDTEVSIGQINQIIERLRQLTAGLMGAIGPAARSFSQRHLARFGPDAIKDLATVEGGGMFSNAEQRNWRKYVQVSKDLSEDSIESEMVDCVARYAEGLMRGTSSTPNL